MQEEDLLDYQRDLEILLEPFPLLIKAHMQQNQTTPVNHTISPYPSSYRPL
jgi:hypothetical protein